MQRCGMARGYVVTIRNDGDDDVDDRGEVAQACSPLSRKSAIKQQRYTVDAARATSRRVERIKNGEEGLSIAE